ncbi:MAG: membrane protein insertase YidC [Bacteroidota bacterium]
MDKNNIIGITLIFILFFIWARINSPSPEEIAERERIQDSIRLATEAMEEVAMVDELVDSSENSTAPTALPEDDSLQQVKLQGTFGPFAYSALGENKTETLENDLFKVEFSSKGGKIKSVLLKEYQKVLMDSTGEETKIPLYLLEDLKNRFEYSLPVAGLPGEGVLTSDLYFTPIKEDSTLIMRASAGEGRYFEQRYTIGKDNYNIDYEVRFVGLDQVLGRSGGQIPLNWVNYLDKLELNTQYERNYSSVYYKEAESDVDYCSCTSDDEQSLEKPVKWVSNSNQFFNSTLIAADSANFKGVTVSTEMLEENSKDLKKLTTALAIPYGGSSDERFAMKWYVGPNEFEQMRAYDLALEDVIPYGWSIFGTINRWIIRPLFNFLSGFISNKGIVILVLTLIVKLVLFPLTYRMLYSQSKMGALKPRLAGLKEKFGDDAQKQQMETMKLYQEFGVSPLGGCMPIFLQMPIWFALYRFFPGSIEFRQASFLWATDLSSFDVFAMLPFEIPFYGAHVSLFTLLWAGTTIIYTYYNTRHMDMSVNPMMKYMQYMMPVMFLFFFNNFAAGLTCYLFFSNIINIGQTVITKNYIIDQDKIKAELEAYRKKPKKKGGFQERLEKALREQQKVAQDKQQQATSNKKKKKK